MLTADLLVAVTLTAIIVTIICGLTAALALERERRRALHERVVRLEGEQAELRQQLSSLERLDRNPLYRESLEDQRARELRAAYDMAAGIALMRQALRALSPEMASEFMRAGSDQDAPRSKGGRHE